MCHALRLAVPFNIRSVSYTHLVHYARTLQPLYAPEHLVLHKDTHQAHVMIGSRGYNAYDDKRTALYLLNNVLGGRA